MTEKNDTNKVELNKQEVMLICMLRDLQYGRIEIIVREGIPQKIIKKEEDIILKT